MLLLLILYAYLIGSIPTAYIAVRIFSGKDILKSGDFNNGAYNALKVTNNIAVTLIVLAIDLMKGALVALTYSFFNGSELGLIAAVISVLLGHNYSIWLRFKGGKGLATSSGILIVLAPQLVFLIVFFSAVALSMIDNVEYAGLSTIPLIFLIVLFYYPQFLIVSLICGLFVISKDTIKILNKRKILQTR